MKAIYPQTVIKCFKGYAHAELAIYHSEEWIKIVDDFIAYFVCYIPMYHWARYDFCGWWTFVIRSGIVQKNDVEYINCVVMVILGKETE